jgi:hypothetical protein
VALVPPLPPAPPALVPPLPPVALAPPVPPVVLVLPAAPAPPATDVPPELPALPGCDEPPSGGVDAVEPATPAVPSLLELEDWPPLPPAGWARLTTSGAPQLAANIRPTVTTGSSRPSETSPSLLALAASGRSQLLARSTCRLMVGLLSLITYRVPAEGLETEMRRAHDVELVCA